MSVDTETDPFEPFGECDRKECTEPCPWDMVGILFDHERGYCSPDCALTVLEGMDGAPEEVTLHDPQYAIDREPLGIRSDIVDLVREVDGKADAEDAIREAAQLYGGRFRVAR